MYWLEIIRTFWPIAVIILPLVVATGFIWLRTQFPTTADLKKAEEGILAKIGAHDDRLAEGSRKLADLDKRVALVEDDCESAPSKSDLNQAMAVLSGRMSGVESALKGVDRQLTTQHDYLRTLVDRGLQP